MAEAKTETLSPREQMAKLALEMRDAQLTAVVELRDLMGNEDTAKVVDALKAIQAKTIPGQQLDQQISGFLSNFSNMLVFATSVEQNMRAQLAAERLSS